MARVYCRSSVAALAFFTLTILGAANGNCQESQKPTAESLAELVRQLDSNRFSQRQLASQKLYEAGREAIPALADAGLNGPKEAASRSVDVLKKLLQSSDEATKIQAKEALEKIAKSDTSPASKTAEQILTPKKPPTEPLPPGQQIPGPRIQIGGAQLQFQLGGGNGGITKRVSVENGVKKIDVQEKGRKIKISDDPNQGIQVEVTETKDGQEVTKKYEAKNADELRKNHPDAHQLYEAHSKNILEINGLQIQQGVFPLGNLPIQIDPRNVLDPFQNREQVHGLLSKAGKQLNDAIERLEKTRSNPSRDEIAKALESLENARKELDDAREKAK